MLIIILSTRCVTFFGLSVDPLVQSSRPYFSEPGYDIIYSSDFQGEQISDFLQRFTFVAIEIHQLYNIF